DRTRADTHDGPEHKRLQSKAGYTDARPHIRQLDESSLAKHGRTIHRGSFMQWRGRYHALAKERMILLRCESLEPPIFGWWRRRHPPQSPRGIRNLRPLANVGRSLGITPCADAHCPRSLAHPAAR